MLIGIDTYSYHRLLGELRVGEDSHPAPWPDGSLSAVREARRAGAEIISLQTAFLGPVSTFDEAPYLEEAAGELQIMLSWGHPDGLRWGTSPEQVDDLRAWLPHAVSLGYNRMRITVSGAGFPKPEGFDWFEATSRALRPAIDAARAAGIELIVENHVDVDIPELTLLMETFDELGVCFDPANAQRLGDDPVEAARTLHDRIRAVHLKDVEPWDPEHPPWAVDTPGGKGGLGRGAIVVPMGTGSVPVEAVLDVLSDIPDLVACVELGQFPSGTFDELPFIADAVAWTDRYRRGV